MERALRMVESAVRPRRTTRGQAPPSFGVLGLNTREEPESVVPVESDTGEPDLATVPRHLAGAPIRHGPERRRHYAECLRIGRGDPPGGGPAALEAAAKAMSAPGRRAVVRRTCRPARGSAGRGCRRRGSSEAGLGRSTLAAAHQCSDTRARASPACGAQLPVLGYRGHSRPFGAEDFGQPFSPPACPWTGGWRTHGLPPQLVNRGRRHAAHRGGFRRPHTSAPRPTPQRARPQVRDQRYHRGEDRADAHGETTVGG